MRHWPDHLPEVLYAYNSMPHAATGYSPYYLLFGVEPRLPVDVLLGVDEEQEEVDDTLNEWVQQHREKVHEARQQARKQLERELQVREDYYNRKQYNPPIHIGQLVYVKDRSIRGRNKIQDIYNPCVYQVVDQPDERNAIYVIQPVDTDGPIRIVNRTEVRLCERKKQQALYRDAKEQLDDEAGMFVYIPEVQHPAAQVDAAKLPPVRAQRPIVRYEKSPERVTVRRSQRSNKGQHSNPYHLPKSVLR